MKAKIWYRVAAVMLVLFAAGHTMGFRQVDPKWGADAVVAAMKSVHFDVEGFNRNYWGFYTGFGFFVTILELFLAVLTWQMAGLAPEVLGRMGLVAWGLVACFGAVTVLSWKYFFMTPVIFSVVITVCLIVGAVVRKRS
jgi:hypothetical protein